MDKRTKEYKASQAAALAQKNDGPKQADVIGLACGILTYAHPDEWAFVDAITLVKVQAAIASELLLRATRKGNIDADV